MLLLILDLYSQKLRCFFFSFDFCLRLLFTTPIAAKMVKRQSSLKKKKKDFTFSFSSTYVFSPEKIWFNVVTMGFPGNLTSHQSLHCLRSGPKSFIDFSNMNLIPSAPVKEIIEKKSRIKFLCWTINFICSVKCT